MIAESPEVQQPSIEMAHGGFGGQVRHDVPGLNGKGGPSHRLVQRRRPGQGSTVEAVHPTEAFGQAIGFYANALARL
jgi:hypothetical protein